MPFAFQPFPRLTTDRLVLRKPTSDHLEMIFFLRSDHAVMQYINRPVMTEREEAMAFLQKIRAETRANESIFWAITLKPDTEMIGAISLWNFSEDLKTAEIGYSLHPDYQNHGIMQEAMEAALGYGFETLDFETIEAFTNKWNEPSQKLLLKAGFKLMPERVDESDATNNIYRIEKEDFMKNHASP